MQPIEFPQQTDVLAKDQPQYTPLPVHVGSREDNYPMTACFQLSDEEISEIVATKKLWYTQVTFGHAFQPVMLSTQNPFEHTSQRSVSPIGALVDALTKDPDYRETLRANIAMSFKDVWDSWEFHKYPAGTVKGKELVPSIHELANKAADNFLEMLCQSAK